MSVWLAEGVKGWWRGQGEELESYVEGPRGTPLWVPTLLIESPWEALKKCR